MIALGTVAHCIVGVTCLADVVAWELTWEITATAQDPWHVDEQFAGEDGVLGAPDAPHIGFASIGAVVFGEPEQPEWNRHASAEFWTFVGPTSGDVWSGDLAFGAHGFGVGEGVATATGSFALTFELDEPALVSLTGLADRGAITLVGVETWSNTTFAGDFLLDAGTHRLEGVAGFDVATTEDVFANFGVTIAIPGPGVLAFAGLVSSAVRRRRR